MSLSLAPIYMLTGFESQNWIPICLIVVSFCVNQHASACGTQCLLACPKSCLIPALVLPGMIFRDVSGSFDLFLAAPAVSIFFVTGGSMGLTWQSISRLVSFQLSDASTSEVLEMMMRSHRSPQRPILLRAWTASLSDLLFNKPLIRLFILL